MAVAEAPAKNAENTAMQRPVVMKFKHVCIEAMAVNLPPIEVSSSAIEDRLSPVYQRLGIPFGTLERISAVQTRYFWEPHVLPSEAATGAAVKALEQLPFDRSKIGALFSCSVTRDFFEPATACLVHGNLGLGEHALVMDIGNACIGFANGMSMVATLIENGTIDAGLVVSGETISRLLDTNIEAVVKDTTIDRDMFLKLLPMFTLGSGAVAYVLCHEKLATKGRRLLATVSRAATQHNELCTGNGDYVCGQVSGFSPVMFTESAKLISAASYLGGRTWHDASEAFGWSADDIDHIFCHQVGKQVNEAFYQTMGLDIKKEFTIYRKYGNLASAAMPTALVLGAETKNIQAGQKVLLTAFGSGLNSHFMALSW